MSTPVYDPPRGKNSYLAYVTACGIGIVFVVWRYVADLMSSVSRGVVTVPIRTSTTTDVLQPPGGATVRSDQFALQVRTADFPGAALGYIRVGDAIEVVAVTALIALVGAVAWRISRGGLFDRATPRILDWIVALTLTAGILPDFVRRMGWNWVVSALGWDGHLPVPLIEPQYVPVYLGVLVVTCFRFALSASQRMVRDQAGLV
ncbi:hypothetical protein [Curtobacterium sp. MCBA15_008]|uniref:hypothetical protein n=1 Tax=Curtobacterium sp. MCBA15_008 TaxID=1898736 RepID=UPI0008DE931F|nr:hypothetical protein [Curtobacterium sp. MCBA15_008]OII14592.1 hypothetical protein BIU96_10445 [Curtobacterium sp. MCBA15_008]